MIAGRVTVLAVVVILAASLASADEAARGAPAAGAPLSERVIAGLDEPLRVRFHVTVGGKAWREHFEEIQRRYLQAMFAQLDADRNGSLSSAEAKRMPPPRAWASLSG